MTRRMVLTVVLAGLVAVLGMGVVYAGDNTTAPQQGAHAKGARAGNMTVDKRMERLTRVLSLTEPQQTAIKAILEARRAEVKAVFQDKALPKDQRRATIVAIVKGTHDSIRALLDDAQKVKYDELSAKVKERMKERRQKQGA